MIYIFHSINWIMGGLCAAVILEMFLIVAIAPWWFILKCIFEVK